MAALVSPEGTQVDVDEATAERLKESGWKPPAAKGEKPPWSSKTQDS